MLSGPDNTSDYTYVGLVDVTRGVLRLTRASKFRDDSGPVVALNWIMRRIWAGRDIQPAEIWHIGRCGRCGRALTVPSSIASGLGPECSAILAGGK